ncbi:TPA: flagellar hook-basal body complex protein [Burkholderia cenocepacia]|uniref:flagellar hook protein FlgE n=1 Tax=unclassified Burkholderia TaxID=2613784 RepID=UPI00158F21EA|nr:MULTISPECIES: flagellar hook-basal body complex protein [unclassified Burkholderia]HEF5875109.1 flagellar hook-basal body complex protein [Burkholderia cenocepacia]
MLDSIYIGMSGLTAYSKGLQTIGNNVANLNTPGFKSSAPRFQDLYDGRPTARDAQRSGSGVAYAHAALNFRQGELRGSTGQLDLAIDGEGLLALRDGETIRYARTGQFHVADDGFVTERTSGLRLAALDPAGPPTPISLANRQLDPPRPTRVVRFTDNLSPGSTDFSVSNIEVYDANGATHVLKVSFALEAGVMPGRWKVTVSDPDGTPLQIGALQFHGGIPEPGQDKIDVTLPSSRLTVTLDFSDGVTAFSAGATSTLRMSQQDGYAAGTLASMSIDRDGQLALRYSNGQTGKAGAIALARFADPRLLVPLGEGQFDASRLAPPRYAKSGDPLVGQLRSGAIEASNVDLSGEFGQLILIQRGFQAASQVISTSNEMIMQLFQMRGQG